MEVREIVCCPGCQQVRQRNDSQVRMLSAAFHIFRGKAQTEQFCQSLFSNIRKVVEQLPQCLSVAIVHMPVALKRRKDSEFSTLQNHIHARHPILMFALNQVG